MMRYCLALAFACAAVPAFASTPAKPNPQIDFATFRELTEEVEP